MAGMLWCAQYPANLMYLLRRIGYTGGLKAIEQLLGVTRSEDTTGGTGFDAVRLWHEYERGSTEGDIPNDALICTTFPR